MRIQSPELNSEQDKYIAVIYDLGIQFLCALNFWAFNQRIIQLPLAAADYAIPNYKYKYDLPSDMENMVNVFNDNYIEKNYTIIGSSLYANYNPLYLRYSSNSYPNDNLPIHFANCLAFFIAKEAAPVFGQINLLPGLIQQYEQALGDARLVEQRNLPTPLIDSNYYLAARL